MVVRDVMAIPARAPSPRRPSGTQNPHRSRPVGRGVRQHKDQAIAHDIVVARERNNAILEVGCWGNRNHTCVTGRMDWTSATFTNAAEGHLERER
jgi:hypothetical protein